MEVAIELSAEVEVFSYLAIAAFMTIASSAPL
jgi:hypothetical protein